jgi:hypothetical protein
MSNLRNGKYSLRQADWEEIKAFRRRGLAPQRGYAFQRLNIMRYIVLFPMSEKGNQCEIVFANPSSVWRKTKLSPKVDAAVELLESWAKRQGLEVIQVTLEGRCCHWCGHLLELCQCDPAERSPLQQPPRRNAQMLLSMQPARQC